jgi:hypothetical protein
MDCSDFTKNLFEISKEKIKRNRDKSWSKATEELMAAISALDSFINDISKSRLELRMTHEAGDKRFGSLDVHLYDKKNKKVVFKNLLKFLNPKNGEYPVGQEFWTQNSENSLPVRTQIGLGDQDMIFRQILLLFEHERTPLVEYLAKCEEIT